MICLHLWVHREELGVLMMTRLSRYVGGACGRGRRPSDGHGGLCLCYGHGGLLQEQEICRAISFCRESGLVGGRHGGGHLRGGHRICHGRISVKRRQCYAVLCGRVTVNGGFWLTGGERRRP